MTTPSVSAPVDLCVIGGGEAGFAAALAGAALGLRVVLVTASAADPSRRNWDVALSALRDAGLRATQAPCIGPPPFWADIDAALTAAAPDRRFARLGAMNIRVVRGRASFTGPTVIEVAGETIRARRFILASGSRPAAGFAPGEPPLDRLRRPDPPKRVLIVGGDPRSVALAQGLARVGTDVRLHAPDGLLADLDPELVGPLRSVLQADGIRMGLPGEAAGWPVLHAAETVPTLTGLDLERAGVAIHGCRLALSPASRTSNRRVYAIGGVAGAVSAPAVQAQVGVVMRSAFLHVPVRYEPHLVPVVVVSDPEIAAVGLSETEARGRGPVTVLRWPLGETARGAGRAEAGQVKVVADGRGRVLGAGIVGPGAAEGIGFWTLALRSGATLPRLAEVALPSPSFSKASRRLLVQHAAGRLRSPLVKHALRLLGRLG